MIKQRVVWWGVLWLGLGLVMAQTADSIAKQVQANLERSPWEVSVVGKIQLPDGSSQDADFKLQVLPGKDNLARVEFNRPLSLEGNFVVISDKEVWNYLFLTNQLIIQSRAKAQVEGLGVNLTALGDFDQLTSSLTVRLSGEAQTAEGAAWRLIGTPKDVAAAGYAQMEMLVLKSDPRPVTVRLRDSDNKVLAELNFRNFKRIRIDARGIRKYPADAEVVRR